MEIRKFLESAAPAWLSEKETGSLLSLRLTLARDLAGCAFPHRADAKAKRETAEKLAAAIAGTGEAFVSVRASTLTENERELLEEKLGITVPGGEGSEAVLYTNADASLAILVNGEDHLTILAMQEGSAAAALWRKASFLESRIGHAVSFAFDKEFGYLTASPASVGTGLHMTASLFLPGITLGRAAGQLSEKAARSGFTLRRLGEGKAYRYELSNASTLGFSEETIAGRMTQLLSDIEKAETALWEKIYKANESAWKDAVWRALGTLKYARLIDETEAMEAAAKLRIGLEEGIFPESSKLYEMLSTAAGAAYVKEKTHKEDMSGEEEKLWRAALLRGLVTEAGL